MIPRRLQGRLVPATEILAKRFRLGRRGVAERPGAVRVGGSWVGILDAKNHGGGGGRARLRFRRAFHYCQNHLCFVCHRIIGFSGSVVGRTEPGQRGEADGQTIPAGGRIFCGEAGALISRWPGTVCQCRHASCAMAS